MRIVLVGNKGDMEDRRKVTKEMGEGLARKYGIGWLEVSAKENRNVRETFEMLTKEVLAKNKGKGKVESTGTVLAVKEEKKEKKKDDCCK